MISRGTSLLLTLSLAAGLGLAACGEQRRVTPPAPVLHLGLQADSAAGAVIVRGGDTLWNISRRYRLPVRDIIDLNGLQPPYALAQGQRLKLPAPVDYSVREGDTLRSVAGMFGVSVSQLVNVNGIDAPYALRPGQVLRIPARSRRGTAMPPEGGIRHAAKPQFIKAPAPQALPDPALRRGGEPLNNDFGGDDDRPPPSKRAGFSWPVRGKVISAYGPKEGGLYNDGINIAAPRGTPVAAAADGIVAYVGDDLESYGNLVLVRHAEGTMTAYAHLGSVSARKGQSVRKGQVIGVIGSTGAVPSAQLHFEIRRGAKTYDPREYLG